MKSFCNSQLWHGDEDAYRQAGEQCSGSSADTRINVMANGVFQLGVIKGLANTSGIGVDAKVPKPQAAQICLVDRKASCSRGSAKVRKGTSYACMAG